MRKLTVLAGAITLAVSLSAIEAQAWWVTPTYSTSSKADFDDFNGDVKSTSYGIMGGNEYFTLGYKATDYSLSGRDLFSDMHLLFADAKYDGKFSAQWGYFAGVGVAFGWEDDFHASDNYNIKPRAGVSYALNQDYTIVGGFGANLNEPDNMFYPILSLNYRNSSDIGLSYKLGFPYFDAMYRINNMFAFTGKVVAVPVKQDVYLLADDNRVLSKGYLVEEYSEGSLGVEFTPHRAVAINAGLSVNFAREYNIYNSDGHEISSYETDPSYGAYLNVRANF